MMTCQERKVHIYAQVEWFWTIGRHENTCATTPSILKALKTSRKKKNPNVGTKIQGNIKVSQLYLPGVVKEIYS